MKVAALDVEGSHFRLGDLDSLGVGVGVEFAGNREADCCGRSGDQLHDRQVTGQRLGMPVLRDVTEETAPQTVKSHRPISCVAPAGRRVLFVIPFLQVVRKLTTRSGLAGQGQRNRIERLINRLKHFRRIATR
jgi:hypothetical protein